MPLGLVDTLQSLLRRETGHHALEVIVGDDHGLFVFLLLVGRFLSGFVDRRDRALALGLLCSLLRLVRLFLGFLAVGHERAGADQQGQQDEDRNYGCFRVLESHGQITFRFGGLLDNLVSRGPPVTRAGPDGTKRSHFECNQPSVSHSVITTRGRFQPSGGQSSAIDSSQMIVGVSAEPSAGDWVTPRSAITDP